MFPNYLNQLIAFQRGFLVASNVFFLLVPFQTTWHIIRRKTYSSYREIFVQNYHLVFELIFPIFTTCFSSIYHMCFDGPDVTKTCVIGSWRTTYALDFIFAYYMALGVVGCHTNTIELFFRWKVPAHIAFAISIVTYVIRFDLHKAAGEHASLDAYFYIYLACLWVLLYVLRAIFFWNQLKWELYNSTKAWGIAAAVICGFAIWCQIEGVKNLKENQYGLLDGYWWKHSLWHSLLGIAAWCRIMMSPSIEYDSQSNNTTNNTDISPPLISSSDDEDVEAQEADIVKQQDYRIYTIDNDEKKSINV